MKSLKDKLGIRLSDLRRGLGRVLRRYPVETALWTLLTALYIWWTEADRFPLFPAAGLWLFPLFAFGALILNTLAGCGPWRRIYFVCWAPLLPLLRWPGLQAWTASEQFGLTLGLLVPLALLLCRRTRDNRRFADEAFRYLRAAAVALFLADTALALFEATLWSAAYIFEFDEMHWVERLAVDVIPIANFLAAPMFFLLLLDRWENRATRFDRLGEVLVNRLITPALVVYALLLHLYAARILLTWSLPRGGVAYLVFGFMLLAFAVRMLREFIERRTAEWFYGRFGFYLLVPVLLFWIGAARRIGEYGLTAPRVYLLVSGIVMTLAVFFFFLRTGRYLRLFTAAFLLFAAVAYLPPLSPARIGLRSQRARFERLGRELGMLDAAGRFLERPVPAAESVRRNAYADLFSAMQYVERRDTAFMRSIGLDNNTSSWRLEYELCPWNTTDTAVVEVSDSLVLVEVELPDNFRVAPDAAYPHLRANIMQTWRNGYEGVRWSGDSLVLTLDGRRLAALTGEELVRRQLEQAGATFEELPGLDAERTAQLLDYRGDEVRILFRSLKIARRDSLACGCDGAEVELVMTR